MQNLWLLSRRLKQGLYVVVFERNQLFSLRWSWRGKRYQFSPKLQADLIGQVAAEMKARQIEIDMATGQFDPTLTKYKGELVQVFMPMTGQTLLTEFAEAMAKLIAAKTLEKYEHVGKKLAKFSRTKLVSDYTERTTLLFRDYLLTEVAPISAAEYFFVINAVWEWGISKGWLQSNP